MFYCEKLKRMARWDVIWQANRHVQYMLSCSCPCPMFVFSVRRMGQRKSEHGRGVRGWNAGKSISRKASHKCNQLVGGWILHAAPHSHNIRSSRRTKRNISDDPTCLDVRTRKWQFFGTTKVYGDLDTTSARDILDSIAVATWFPFIFLFSSRQP